MYNFIFMHKYLRLHKITRKIIIYKNCLMTNLIAFQQINVLYDVIIWAANFLHMEYGKINTKNFKSKF